MLARGTRAGDVSRREGLGGQPVGCGRTGALGLLVSRCVGGAAFTGTLVPADSRTTLATLATLAKMSRSKESGISGASKRSCPRRRPTRARRARSSWHLRHVAA